MPRLRLLILVALLSAGASVGSHAQWLHYPTPGTPRTPDGKPNLAAPTPRTADGKPDLSGVWRVPPTPLAEWKLILGGDRVESALNIGVPTMAIDNVSKYSINILSDFKPEESPMRPEAVEIFRRQVGTDSPAGRCLPVGIPADVFFSIPVQFVQSPALIVMLLEADGTHRKIYTDGRELPKEVAQPSYLGYSVGKWEQDTLVVNTAGFNDITWLDDLGHPHSEALRIRERYHRRDFGHMDVEMTLDDPKMYTKPLTFNFTEELLADSDTFEYVCNENEKDRARMRQK